MQVDLQLRIQSTYIFNTEKSMHFNISAHTVHYRKKCVILEKILKKNQETHKSLRLEALSECY